MKSLLISGALAVLVAGPAYGLAPLMTDDFSYGAAAGNLTTLTANWVAHSGTTGFVGYQTSTLSLAGYAFGGAGGAATISNVAPAAEDVNRSIGGVQAGDIYFSALVNISAASTGNYFLHFKDATTGFRAKVFARESAGSLQFGLTATSNTGVYSATNFSYNTTYLLVIHYNGTTGLTALHVLTTVPATEPAPLLSETDAAPLGTMQAVAIRQSSGAAGTPTAIIDGIRVGTTWADLLPVELMNFDVK